ncbi:TIGR02269 family lipoprotein [Myxococcus sp. MxC21-1]|uniref:SitA6 family polymorphic toxin lipoprotein n=1 Tax=Myxococcus sp. MxC21-1 TaxID=3041439 RepID=UPI00292FE960|nr:TIGR02269 family lipoprotein [Myxococcus sp. MxC21-1]WNZ62534.1 TIGR02269 family lipoprotein [Myxococcus sp. MxC21-1]
MRIHPGLGLSLLVAFWLGCSTTAKTPIQRAAHAATEACSASHEDRCVSLLCEGDSCGFYRCEDLFGEVELARFPPARPPVAAAAPGSGPRRNWGGGQQLPRGAVMVFPNWNGGSSQVISPSHRLTPGRWEKHHIFPQAEDLARWFEGQGVKIHSYTMPIPRDVHRRIHGPLGNGGAWNKAWREFRDRNRNASAEEIFKHAGELIHRFELIGGPIQPYYSRPGA